VKPELPYVLIGEDIPPGITFAADALPQEWVDAVYRILHDDGLSIEDKRDRIESLLAPWPHVHDRRLIEEVLEDQEREQVLRLEETLFSKFNAGVRASITAGFTAEDMAGWASRMLPERISNEEIGDALEAISHRRAHGESEWRLLISMAWAVTLACRHSISLAWRRSTAPTRERR
jgi:hypothetical protein